jgi:hypothetical protein
MIRISALYRHLQREAEPCGDFFDRCDPCPVSTADAAVGLVKGEIQMKREVMRMIKIQLEDTASALLFGLLILLLVLLLGGCDKRLTGAPNRTSEQVRTEAIESPC